MHCLASFLRSDVIWTSTLQPELFRKCPTFLSTLMLLSRWRALLRPALREAQPWGGPTPGLWQEPSPTSTTPTTPSGPRGPLLDLKAVILFYAKVSMTISISWPNKTGHEKSVYINFHIFIPVRHLKHHSIGTHINIIYYPQCLIGIRSTWMGLA